MGRHNGSWSKHYMGIWDHPKTLAAARELQAAGVPQEYASHVIVCALMRLAAWALHNGDTGETSGLTDAKLCSVAWGESVESRRFGNPARTGAVLRRILRTAGFLEDIRGVEGIHDFQEVYLELLNKRRDNRKLPPWTAAEIAKSGGRIVPQKGPDDPPPQGPTQGPGKGPTKGPAGSAERTAKTPDSPGYRGGSRARARDRAPESDPPVAGSPDVGAATTYAPPQGPTQGLNDVRGSGSGSGSGRGGDAEPPHGIASHPAADKDREASEVIAGVLNEDVELVRQVLRELALKGVSREQAVRTALDLDGPIGAWAFKAHALDVAKPAKPAAPDPGARPPSDGRGLAASRDHAAEAERLRAEFEASGYVDRNAWNADRRAGQLRTGPAAAGRRWSLERKAYDVEQPSDERAA